MQGIKGWQSGGSIDLKALIGGIMVKTTNVDVSIF
jgi:hypothetical protein